MPATGWRDSSMAFELVLERGALIQEVVSDENRVIPKPGRHITHFQTDVLFFSQESLFPVPEKTGREDFTLSRCEHRHDGVRDKRELKRQCPQTGDADNRDPKRLAESFCQGKADAKTGKTARARGHGDASNLLCLKSGVRDQSINGGHKTVEVAVSFGHHGFPDKDAVQAQKSDTRLSGGGIECQNHRSTRSPYCRILVISL